MRKLERESFSGIRPYFSLAKEECSQTYLMWVSHHGGNYFCYWRCNSNVSWTQRINCCVTWQFKFLRSTPIKCKKTQKILAYLIQWRTKQISSTPFCHIRLDLFICRKLNGNMTYPGQWRNNATVSNQKKYHDKKNTAWRFSLLN